MVIQLSTKVLIIAVALFFASIVLANNNSNTAIELINKVNYESYKDLLNPSLETLISQHDMTVKIDKTFEFTQNTNYIKATEGNTNTVFLGASVGELNNYLAGRPFPSEPDVNDRRAGEKIAWNMRYTFAPDESNTDLMTWMYKRMDADSPDRTIDMFGAIMRFSHRHHIKPYPDYEENPYNLYSALYLKVKSPQDIRNTQLLIHTKKDDAQAEQAWMYLNTQRRVRRLSTGQKTDAFLGSDIMIEDFLGYNGRIRDQHWTFLGSAEKLLPMYDYGSLPGDNFTNRDEFQVIDFEGPGACYPKITWQKRKVYLLEAKPVNQSHPLTKRIFVIDAQTYLPVLTQIFDKAGNLWKLGIAATSDSANHKNQNWEGPVTDAVSMIDLQAEHCTTIQFVVSIPETGLKAKTFTTQHMRSSGR